MPSRPPSSPAPHNLEAERTLIGALLMDPEKMFDVAAMLSHVDFYDTTLGTVYQTIAGLYEERKSIDFVTVADALKERKQVQDIGGSAFLASLVEDVPTASHATHYAGIVKEKSIRRQLLKTGQSICSLARDDKSADEIREFAEQQLLRVTSASTIRDPVSVREAREDWYDRYSQLTEATGEERQMLLGIPTGFASLDRLVTMSPGDLVVLAARPSMGKTALALNVADHVAKAYRKNVLVMSLEMTRQQLLDRIIAARIGVETQRLRRGELTADESARLGKALDALDDDHLFIDDDPDRRLVNLRSKARRMQVQHGIDLLVVDYLQLVAVDGPVAQENHTRQISYVSNSLKQLARELNCPILALSQLSRKCEERYDKRPLLSDLRQSGEIEQDADTVLMLYRDSYYDEDCDDPGHTELYVRKNRQGATGLVRLDFNHRAMIFRERTEHVRPQVREGSPSLT